MSHRTCTCSSRALQVFIKDVAGLNLRRPLPRVPRRKFGTRPGLRHLETVSAGSAVEDGFIPFEYERVKRGAVGSTKDNVMKESWKKEVVDEEWHAEIEIQSAWPGKTRNEGTEEAAVSEGPEVRGEVEPTRIEASMESGQEPAVDSVALHYLHPSPSAIVEPSFAMPPPLAAPTKFSGQENAASAEGRSRAENRWARKQRRMLEGTWGRQKVEREQVSVVEVQNGGNETAAVLQQIEAMEGPAVGRKKKSMESKAKIGVERAEFVEGGKRAKRKDTKMREPEAEKMATKKDLKRPDAARGEKLVEMKAEGAKTPERERIAAKAETKDAVKRNPTWETWRVQKEALKAKFGDAGWDPSKKLSPDTMNGIRALRASDPAAYTTAKLAQHFQITPEAIRRILRSRWRPSEDETERRRVAWEQRGVKKWEDMASKGIKPPKKWRELGVAWGQKSRSSTPKSAGVARVKETVGMEEGVGMLGGIEEGMGMEERIA